MTAQANEREMKPMDVAAFWVALGLLALAIWFAPNATVGWVSVGLVFLAHAVFYIWWHPTVPWDDGPPTDGKVQKVHAGITHLGDGNVTINSRTR